MHSPLLSRITSIDLDFLAGRSRVQRVSGESSDTDLKRPAELGSIASCRLDLTAGRLDLTLLSKQRLSVPVDPRLLGRPAAPPPPTLYLDQSHWVALARTWLGRPARRNEDVSTMQQIIELARNGRLALPFCFGRAIETTRIGEQQRVELARAQIELSAGWAVRHVITVREEELRAILAGRPGPLSDVVALGPSGLRLPQPAPSEDELVGWLGAATSFYDTYLETEALDSVQGRDDAQKWAESMHSHSQQLAGMSRERRPAEILSIFVADLRPELDAVYRTDSRLFPAGRPELLALIDEHLAAAPALSWYHDLLAYRLRNSTDKWEGNDLIDMTSLTVAVAYCDFVVAENKIGRFLVRCGHGSPGAVITTSFAQVGDAMRDAGLLT